MFLSSLLYTKKWSGYASPAWRTVTSKSGTCVRAFILYLYFVGRKLTFKNLSRPPPAKPTFYLPRGSKIVESSPNIIFVHNNKFPASQVQILRAEARRGEARLWLANLHAKIKLRSPKIGYVVVVEEEEEEGQICLLHAQGALNILVHTTRPEFRAENYTLLKHTEISPKI